MKLPNFLPPKKAPAEPKPAPEKKTAPVKAVAVPKASAPAKPSSSKYLIGLALVTLAFVGVVAIMYLMMNTIAQKEADIKKLDEVVQQLKQEKEISQAEIDNLKAQGDSIKLDKLVETAKAFYDDKEMSRKEGLVWVNRKNKTYVATLGAIHGLKAGSKLAVFDGGNKIGSLQVDTPYDVISFCSPISIRDSSDKSYYRILIE